jgi:hypothetical protein
MFVPNESSPTGRLRVLCGIQLFPGIPGQIRDCMKTFTFEGDVVGVDLATVAFNLGQLRLTADIIVPGSIARTQQLLGAEPTKDMLGYFAVDAVNTHMMKCWMATYMPFEFMELVLGVDFSERQA